MDESCDCELTKIEAETRETKSTRNRVKLCNGGSMDLSKETEISKLKLVNEFKVSELFNR